MAREQIIKIQNILKERNLYGYIAFSSDYHGSEYIVDYFKTRQFLSGFTGSAGTLLITQDSAYLWTDGRYFIQAEQQLKNTGIILMKMRQKGVPTLIDFLKEHTKGNDVVAFDGKVATIRFVKDLKNQLNKVILKTDEDLASLIWDDRPPLPKKKMFVIENQTGKSASSKINEIKDKLNSLGAKHHLISSLDDIAWTLNLRGKDIYANPVFLSYLYIGEHETTLFVDAKKLTQEVKKHLQLHQINYKPYQSVYSFVKKIKGVCLLDPNKTNYALYKKINKKNVILLQDNPTILLKAIKNDVEILNIKNAHILDGIAVTKFIKYVKDSVEKKEITEISATKYLYNLRRQHKQFIGDSFETICAYKQNAALMHYSANEDSNAILKNEGMLLVDSGGQYLYGTTDITRTIILGPITPKERMYYTLALKSHINLAMARFLNETTGASLDILARQPLWRVDMDYRCGTGHGIGYLLNVHEGPNAFRYNYAPTIIKEGMITTNEPGVYIENEFGIRHENELLTVFATENEYGTFLKFEPITYVPFDLDGIDFSLLNKEEIAYLNKYHRMVYTIIAPHLNKNEQKWLKNATREINYDRD